MALEELDTYASSSRVLGRSDRKERSSTEAAKEAIPRFDGITMAMYGDMIQSVVTSKVDGDANAWRVELDVFGNKEVTTSPRTMGLRR